MELLMSVRKNKDLVDSCPLLKKFTQVVTED